MSNIIKFPTHKVRKAVTPLNRVQEALGLPLCNKVKECMGAKEENFFNCPHWERCEKCRVALVIYGE